MVNSLRNRIDIPENQWKNLLLDLDEEDILEENTSLHVIEEVYQLRGIKYHVFWKISNGKCIGIEKELNDAAILL